MRVELDTSEQHLIARVAAVDIGKAEMVCCVRVPGPGRARAQEVRTFSTMAEGVLDMADWLARYGVTLVVMESTSDYWKPVFYLIEDRVETWLVNARDVKHLPGRPKTDRLDAVWLCKVAERQMLRPSFVPPPPIRQLRDLTRYRVDLVAARTAEKQRVEKLLEDAGVKLSVVASDIFGVSGRAMMDALIAGERDPARLSDLPGAGCGPRPRHCSSRSSLASANTTRSSSRRCWPGSTRSAPTSSLWMRRSPTTSALSLTPSPGSARSPGSVR